jgi:hypothetical protein
MSADNEREYHTERARVELDQAYRAESSAAAEAHMKLSSLHMQRLQDLGSGRGVDSPN